ncbi:uncharacterized protein LOC103942294 [Pyrus x bretschneideri]|uniref:uncharacterized protein LOC103942294 n=1 Tax=Pyrus x bretschneideri TaxID=225117 RepID=UPI0020306010|nr:uncharacterized protein LOC103942294 [Pyrus x bretschneideri]
MSYLVTSLYGGPLEFTFIVQSTEDPAYRAVSMLLSELKDEVDVKIVVAGISTTCGQKIHNQLQKTLRRANRHNQFCQNCWRIPQPRSSSTAGSMLRVEMAKAPMLARAATPFQEKPKTFSTMMIMEFRIMIHPEQQGWICCLCQQGGKWCCLGFNYLISQIHFRHGWSRTWGEEHFGNGKVHKYGKGTTGESWDVVGDEETYYELIHIHSVYSRRSIS